MRKKISYILLILMLTLGLAGCSEQKNVSYDEETITYACNQMFALISSETIAPEQVTALSDWNQGYLMAQIENQTGIKISADDFVTALQGWESSKEECGTYVEHGAYIFSTKTTGLKVSTEAVFSERTAKLEFSFDEDLNLESFTVNANFSRGEILTKAGLNTLLGMGTVFAMLIFISFVISLLKYIPMLMEKKSKNEKPEEKKVNESADIQEVSEIDDTELIAVIAAAIAAYEGTGTEGFVVRSVKRRKSNKWNA